MIGRTNTGGGSRKTLPTLNASYPANVTVNDGSTTSATFKVEIALDGKPAQYSYQWYVNGEAVDGATSETYTRTNLVKYEVLSVYCKVTNEAGTVQSRTATLSVKHTLLYNAGTRYDDVTGGFATAAKKRESSSGSSALAPRVTYNNASVKIDHTSLGAGIAYFKNKIDLTNLKTLHITAQFYFKEGKNNFQLGAKVWSNLGTYYNDNSVATWGPATNTHTATQNVPIDVSSVSGSHYIGFYIQTSGSAGDYYIAVTKMWLEG